MMKAKAEAEAKELQAKGMKRGEDFLDCECLGPPHAYQALISHNTKLGNDKLTFPSPTQLS